MPPFHYLFLLLFLPFVHSSAIQSFTEAQIWQYLNHLSAANLSSTCSESLRHVVPMLTASSTLDQQRRFFYKSFASGDSEQLISLDMDRWFHRSIECLKVAGETIFSASDYPVHYCFGANQRPHSKAYGICIPSTCAGDRQKVNFEGVEGFRSFYNDIK